MKLYKKGSIIPRRIVQADHRSYQHRLKFGCDVYIHNGKVKTYDKDGSIITIMGGHNRNKSGRGGIRNMSFTVQDVSIIGAGNTAAFKIIDDIDFSSYKRTIKAPEGTWYLD